MEKKIIEMVAAVIGADAHEITPELDLFDAGLLDSFGVLQLWVALTDAFGIDLDVTDVPREQLASAAKIKEFLSQKKGIV